MDIVPIVNNIKSCHNFQKLFPNHYEQGNVYDKCCQYQFENNNYVRFVKPNHRSTGRVSCPKPLRPTHNPPTSLFEKLVYIHESGVIMNFVEYKNVFYNSLSNEIYKSVSKRHQLLKKDMYTFVHDIDFVLPTNKDVLLMMSQILAANIVVLVSSREFVCFRNTKVDRSILLVNHNVTANNTLKDDLYPTFEALFGTMCALNYVEFKNVTDMKIAELKTYASSLGINLVALKKKKEIADAIHTMRNNFCK